MEPSQLPPQPLQSFPELPVRLTSPSDAHALNSIQRDIQSIKTALAGDEFGNTGLVQRLKAVEKKADEHDKKLTRYSAGLVTIVSGLELLHYFTNFKH